MQVANGGDVYRQKYKNMALALGIFRYVLAGRYVAFGVFRIYNDPALDDAFQIIFQIISAIPVHDMTVRT